MFSKFIVAINTILLLILLGTGVMLLKLWSDKKADAETLSQAQLRISDLEEKMRHSEHATLHFGKLHNILELGLVNVEISGTKFIKEPLQESIQKTFFPWSDNYRDYYLEVATFSFDATYSVDLKDVFIKEDSDKVVIYGLKVICPKRTNEKWKTEYTTIIRYPAKKIKDASGRKIEVLDETKFEDVKAKYRKEGYEQFTLLSNKAKEDFFNNCDQGHEVGYVNKIVLENAEGFFKSLFALPGSKKKVEFDYGSKPDSSAINFKELKIQLGN
ncbi:hypothetical protein II898_07900 [bacterium]|nr:hypothetical protein [bacterium]